MLRYIGFVLMLIDHISMMYFPDFIEGRIIGRLCAPIFFYYLAVGYERTTNLNLYLQRLIKWAVIAQLVIWAFVGFEKEPQLNILFTLAYCLISLHIFKLFSDFIEHNGYYATHNCKINKIIDLIHKFALILFLAFWAQIFELEYGWYAVLSVFLFHHRNYTDFKLYWLLLSLLSIFDVRLGLLQVFAYASIYLIDRFERIELKRLPQLNFYALYVLQWFLIALPWDIVWTSEHFFSWFPLDSL